MVRAALLLALVGCATTRVPAALRGDNTIVIANEMAAPLCTLALADSPMHRVIVPGTVLAARSD